MAEDTSTKTKATKASAPTPQAAPDGPPAQAPRGSGGGWKNEFVAQLVAKPNEWMVLSDVSPSVVSHLKKVEGIEGLDKGELEVASRNSRFVEGRKTRVADVYARFVPAGKAK